MTVLRPEAFGRAERLTAQVQTKVTPTEYDELVAIRDELIALGATDVSISSLVRTFIGTGIRAYRSVEDADE